MNREELKSKLTVMVWGVKEASQLGGELTDFILENFVEKPKPTAVERLEKVLKGYFSDKGHCEYAAKYLLQEQLGLLKDIIAEYDTETYKAALRRDVYKG